MQNGITFKANKIYIPSKGPASLNVEDLTYRTWENSEHKQIKENILFLLLVFEVPNKILKFQYHQQNKNISHQLSSMVQQSKTPQN